jgi:hypothetical protein
MAPPLVVPLKEGAPEKQDQDLQAGSGPITFTVEDLASKWGRCCEIIAKQSIALPLVLKAARPVSIRGDVVVLAFTHAFHFDTCNDRRHLDVIEAAVGKVMQADIKIEPILEVSPEEKTLHDLAAAFGGSVVD